MSRSSTSSSQRHARLRARRQSQQVPDPIATMSGACHVQAQALRDSAAYVDPNAALPGSGNWTGTPFADTIGEARRRAEETRRQLSEEGARYATTTAATGCGGVGSSATPEEMMEIQLRLTRFPQLDAKALSALSSLEAQAAIKALRELEAKGPGIRNPSAWICRTAQNLRDRERHQEQQQTRGGEEQSVEQLDIVDHYAALEVPDDADEAAIKKAYRRLVLRWHPDKHPEDRDQAEERIRAINSSYETLSNATKRGAYDAQRQALLRRKRGLGPDVAMTLAPRQRIPREFMLQPIGYPDKFVRYGAERVRSQCFVNSRADSKQEGKSGLEQFVPFFKAAKLSLWWLPEVNNMCRIRALEARTRSSAGEKVVAGRPGGLNLGFRIDLDGTGADSDLIMMEAGKGEKNEMVNFVVVPSPLYDGAFRFEGAYRRGYYLAFQAPTQLRMVPFDGGQVPGRLVVDFTLVDFQAMFKFIDVEEVLRPVVECQPGWVPLLHLKSDPNVVAYFANILQKPMWDDDDFQSYFEGHFETWEFRVAGGVAAVRLRGVDERLGHALERARDADEAASLIVSAGDDVRRLPWRYAAAAFEALARPGSEDVAAVVRRMEAHRRLLASSLSDALADVAHEASLTDLGRLASALRPICGEGLPPDVIQRAEEACHTLGKLVVARVAALERGSSGLDSPVDLTFLGSLLALPGVAGGAAGEALARYTAPPLSEAPLPLLLGAIATACEAKAKSFAREAAQLVLRRVLAPELPPGEAAIALRAVAASGVLSEQCAMALERRCAGLNTGDLATAIVALGEQNFEGPSLVTACRDLAARPAQLTRLPAVALLALAVANTKSTSLAACAGAVVDAAAVSLDRWAAVDAIRLLLAVTKARGDGVSSHAFCSLLRQASAALAPQLPELPASELVRLGLAAGGAAAGNSGRFGMEAAADASQLLEAVAREACRRLSDMPQAHLLLMTQALAALGGSHAAVRQLCGYWGEVLRDSNGADMNTVGDEVSRRRRDVERCQGLSPEQVAKLATVLEPLGRNLDEATAEHCFSGLGLRLLAVGPGALSEASRALLQEQVHRGEGLGLWVAGRERLKRALQPQSNGRSESRGKKHRSRSRSGARQRGGGRTARAAISSSSSSSSSASSSRGRGRRGGRKPRAPSSSSSSSGGRRNQKRRR